MKVGGVKMDDDKKYYELYYSKKDKVIKICPLRKCFDDKKKHIKDNEVFYWNDCYFFGTNRKLLKKKALEIKQEWENGALKEYEAFRDIKI
jgi:hypothetical protein